MPNSYTSLHYHAVFSTKDRRPFLQRDWEDRLHAVMGGIVRERRGVLLAAGGAEDHIHLLLRTHPSQSVSDALRDIKCNSSQWIHRTIDGLSAFGWQDGYAAFTVSLSKLPEVKRYLANQQDHHRKTSFKEEFLKLLDVHGIDYDERYLWT